MEAITKQAVQERKLTAWRFLCNWMPGARAGPTLDTWDRRSLLSLVKRALLLMVSLESLLGHFNNYDKNRTFGCVPPVALARLEASRGQEPHVLFSCSLAPQL